MQRKTIFLIVIIFAFLAGAGLFGFYYYLQKQSSSSPYGGSFSLQNFFPFGNNGSNNNNSSNNNVVVNSNSNTSSSAPLPYPILRHITNVPTAGDTIIDRQIATTSSSTKSIKITKSFIRYIERGTGQIYETLTDSLDTTRVSNTTFPKVYSAYFNSTGSSTVLLTLPNENADVVNTVYGNLSKSNATTSSSTPIIYNLNTTLLSNIASEIAVSPDKKSIFTILSSRGNPGITSNFDSSKQSIVWNSPTDEWIPYWATSNGITMTKKPSFGVAGFSYLLNTSSSKYTRLMGDINGLTTLPSPDLSSVLYSSSDNGNLLSLNLYSVKNKTSQYFSLRTLPEKCVWSSFVKTPVIYCAIPENLPNAMYPDDWYKGLVSFSDSIWKINLTTGESKRIVLLTQLAGQNIDATNLTLDSKEDYLTFINKNDLTLWGLQLPTTSTTSAATSTKK